ncbi:hypothetical protein [Hymenobacter swuensis]|uniref:hypothetical protein n=1 Tax=Hymenobacter swuensis TaxID=1446467 RepID=UPI0005C4B9B5|nr:hypothetical protein [Hymenobacter swuensis]
MKISLYLFFTLLILVLLWLYRVILRQRKTRARQQQDFSEVFTIAAIITPSLAISMRYDWSAFEVTFQTEADRLYAKQHKLCDEFDSRIAAYYTPAFDPKMAISYRVEGVSDYIG